MVNILKLKPIIEKEKIFRRLKLIEDTESSQCSEVAFAKFCELVPKSMKITGIFDVLDKTFELPFECIEGFENWQGCVLCLIYSEDDISNMVNENINRGDYLNGYLMNEMAIEAIFNASDEMNQIIYKKISDMGNRLTRIYAPGDGVLDIVHQKTILEVLKPFAEIDIHLNENYAVIPEKSLIYMFGVINNRSNLKDNLSQCPNSTDTCSVCEKLYCSYRKLT